MGLMSKFMGKERGGEDRRPERDSETGAQLDEQRLAMPPKVEATIVVQKCPTSKKLLGVRLQKKNDGCWYAVWNFPLEEKRAQHENYADNKIEGAVYLDREYKGCPYCGKTGFVQCGSCQKLSCHDGSSTVCPWCGNVMNQFHAGNLKLNGGDI